MVTILLIIILYVSVALYEMVPIAAEKQIKKFVLYGTFMTMALILSVVLSMGIRVPSPMEPITSAVLAIQELLGGRK